jgi:hypothetical protein
MAVRCNPSIPSSPLRVPLPPDWLDMPSLTVTIITTIMVVITVAADTIAAGITATDRPKGT